MAESAHYKTAPEDRIPLGQKFAYATGMFVNNLQAAAIPALMVILNLGLGMSPKLVGILGFVPRMVDAVTDPMMGYISDNTRTKWGRRRPFIFAGAITAGVVFAAMWQLPPGHSEMFYFWVFLGASILYFIAYTVYATPFVAFGFEMTPDYHERTRLQAFANTLGQLPWLFAPWFYAIMANKNLFDDKVEGARTLAYFVGGAILLLGIVPAVFCRERLATTEDDGEEKQGFLSSLGLFFHGIVTTLGCLPFLALCSATFLVFNGYQFGFSFTLYVIKYYIYEGADAPSGDLFGWFGMLTSVFTLAVIPLTALISGRIGKRNTFLITISISLVGYALKWVGYNPNYPYLLLVACPFVAFGTGSLFTLMASMVADVCDYDELSSGQRREGVFGAIYWWMVKLGMALAMLMAGYLLDASGFDVELGSGQTERTLLLLRVFDVVVPLATSAIAIGIMYLYPITEARAHEIRTELESRRGKLG